MSDNLSEFKPYIPAEKITPELTLTSVIIGVLLSIIFGAANAYLGLRVGMTISASIPAAVIAMGVTRIILKRNSILESNMVQTIGSAGESIAAGVIFTLPVLFIWAKEGIIDSPGLLTITLTAICGGLLGVAFMIPLRNSIIVQEHGILPYPEAQACAEVLLAGESKGSGAAAVFAGMGISAVLKFIIDGFKLVPEVISIPLKKLKTEFSGEIYPAVIGVGYICGFRISSFIFSGGFLAWFVMIPLIVIFGGDTVLFPSAISVSALYDAGGPGAIWSNYIRYIGAGALAASGIISLVKSLPVIVKSFFGTVKGLKKTSEQSNLDRTSQDTNIKIVLCGIVCVFFAIWLIPAIQASFVSSILIVIFGFFFATVSAKMVGLVGSSNNPASGMAIATLLLSAFFLKITGDTGSHGMVSALTVGAIVCIIATLSADMSQDLKTGFLLGATPKKQQAGELIGVIVSALSIGGVLMLLDKAWGFGSKELAAPQATLMKIVIEGVMDGNLPWNFVFVGIACAVIFEILGLPALAVSIGIYLPLELSVSIMIGGIVRSVMDKKNKNKSSESSRGVLFSSGLIAGEGIVGIILAILTVCGVSGKIAFGLAVPNVLRFIGSFILLGILIAFMIKFALPLKNEKTEQK